MVLGALSHISSNDAVLLISITYSGYDVLCRWDEFNSCVKPIQWQLIISYALVVVFRVSHFVGQHHAQDDEEFLLNFRHKKAMLQGLVYLTWIVTLPLFIAWTVIGTAWLYDIFSQSAECLPSGTQPWFLVFWQVLSYLWIVVHVVFCVIACDYERRLRSSEHDLRELENDGDILSRWGRMRHFAGYGAAPWGKNRGLSADAIKQLPCEVHSGCVAECSICLNDIHDGDSERCLTGCGHTFHKACIDLWLVRCAECPLCKSEVRRVHESTALRSLV
jgi:hypothetical protein